MHIFFEIWSYAMESNFCVYFNFCTRFSVLIIMNSVEFQKFIKKLNFTVELSEKLQTVNLICLIWSIWIQRKGWYFKLAWSFIGPNFFKRRKKCLNIVFNFISFLWIKNSKKKQKQKREIRQWIIYKIFHQKNYPHKNVIENKQQHKKKKSRI